MGESLAGLFAIETLLKQPDMFSAYIAVDPSLWWSGGSLVRERLLPGWRAQHPKRRVFVAMSSQGPTAEGEALRAGLAASTELDYRVMADETHASVYHPAATDAFRVIFAPPPDAQADSHGLRTSALC
jgi:predicted alpha/beta superfamily hydrolase